MAQTRTKTKHAGKAAGPRRILPYVLLILIPLTLLGLFWAYRGSKAIMNGVIRFATNPYRRFLSWLVDGLPFAMAEVFWCAAILLALGFVIETVVVLIRKGDKLRRLLRRLAVAVGAALIIYCGYTLFWGVYYYGDTFAEQADLVDRGATTEELETLTYSFAVRLNELAEDIPRDEDGCFSVSTEEIFSRSQGIYDNIVEEFPFLEGPERNPKGIYFSRLISYLGFTGFYFPFTGEATVNTDSPACLLPSTIAHEMSHQRGVANENEANFVAILACLHQGDEVYQYSGALMGYIHLSNALYKADYDRWSSVRSTLSSEVLADLSANNAYWQEIKSSKPGSAARKAATKVYDSFASSYGEEDVMQKYEACVDLLVAYYFDREED